MTSDPLPPPSQEARQRLGRNIRRRRVLLALSQYDLSALSGISQHTISTVETAAHPHQPFTIGAIADALGVSPESLWGP